MVVACFSLAVAIEFLHELNRKRLMDADGMGLKLTSTCG
jgi:hypothetical protein